MGKLARVAAGVCLAMVCATSTRAQTGLGQIEGAVTDPTGAVMPATAVELEYVRTGVKFQTTTNDQGLFIFPSLQSGEYSLSASAAGMQRWRGQVLLQAGQRATVDIGLQLARSTEQVTVAGDVTPVITTSSPTRATVVERQRIEQLPLNGRSIQTLLSITVPGLEGSAAQPRVYGLRDSAMEVVQDGVNLQDRNTGAVQARPPGLDSVQEFRVETSVSSAKLDRPASAILSTRSGSNEFHGSLFETGRNSGFGVARRREETFVKPPPLVRNEFGASAGGPVILPKLYNGKNRTFIFGAWEEFRQRQYTTTGSAVWTAPMREGNFGGLTDSSNRAIVLYDPWSVGAGPNYSKSPFPGNQLPLTRQSPLAKYIFGVTPLPTSPVNPLAGQNYFGPAPNHQDTRTYTFRGDHRLSDSDIIFGRYSRGNNDQITRRAFNTSGHPITDDNLYNRETYYERSNSAMTSWTHTFSPAFFVETVGSVSLIDWQYSLNQESARQNISAQFKTPNPFDVNGAPYIINAGFQNTQLHGIVPRSQFTKVYSFEQNYSWVRGKHQIEFGGRLRREALDTIPDRPNQSTLSFDSMATSIYNPATGSNWGTQPQTGDNAANFFLGIAGSYGQARPPGRFDMTGSDYSLYVQDNFKATRNLTLNFGVRWQYLGPYVDSKGVMSVWDFASKSLVKSASIQELIDTGYTTKPIADGYAGMGVKWITPNQAGLSDSLVRVNKDNFGPRVGFAYNPKLGRNNFVIRGGYGVYYFPLPARTFSELRLNPPLQGSYSYSWNNTAQAPDGLPNYFLRGVPTVIAGVNSENVLNISQPPTVLPGVQITGMEPFQPTSKAHEWNMTAEWEVFKDTVLRAGIIGTAGRNIEMMRVFNGNPISNYVWHVNSGEAVPTGFYANTVRRSLDQTTYGDIRIYNKLGYSNFTGVQLEAERRFSRGLAFQFFYLMSNSASTGNTPSQGGDFTVNADQLPERFLKGAMPNDLDDRIRLYRYSRDSDVPKHRLRWNWLYELPVGRGKKWATGAGPVMDRIVGGWQIAGYANANSRYFSIPTNNWGAVNTPEVYGKQYPIEDCRSGQCFAGYMYFNGYITARQRNVANGVKGLPDNYVPAQSPVFPTPATGTVNANFNDTNNVYVRLNNGQELLVALDTGLHPWRNQFLNGPWISSWNASVFKQIRITEKVMFRVNLDAFNVFNQPGIGTPGTDGIISLRTSAQAARLLQYTARLSW